MIPKKNYIWLLSIVLLLLFAACTEEKKEKSAADQPQAISKKIEKKIDIQPKEQVKETPEEKVKDVPAASTDKVKQEIPETEVKQPSLQETPKPKEESSDQAESKVKDFDPTGKINPFMPFMTDETEKAVSTSEDDQKKKREPLTPLEKIDIAQLKLTAITRTPTGNIALVEEASGKGYIITEGTYIGLNSGKVISVLSDKVIIEEEIENIFGKVSIQERELKLQKPTGE